MNLAETKYNQSYPIRINIEINIKNIRSHLQSLLLLWIIFTLQNCSYFAKLSIRVCQLSVLYGSPCTLNLYRQVKAGFPYLESTLSSIYRNSGTVVAYTQKWKKTSLKYLVTAVTIIGGINLEALFYPHLYRKILKSVSSITIQILAQ